ncbi:MAG: hypothetical protein DI603_16890 [Roseateles depolymerans]|uniref:Sensory/regulatory protein RpfC n=1 Tax=Roseateles depolymerans TaxID=76731 RepID=A0A2W5FIB2_9BURK|nr:MAG: hypothetical protein DI603_16890 [Roseateles depolymerans]
MSRLPAWRVGPALLVGFILLSTLPLGLIGLWQVQAFERSLRSTVTDGLATIARKKAQDLNDYVQGASDDARVLAQAVGPQALRERGPFSEGSRSLLGRLYDSTKYQNLLLLRPDGGVELSLRAAPEHASEADLQGELLAAHRRALAQHETQLTAAVRQRGGEATLYVVAPVLDRKQVLGSVVLQLDLSRLLWQATERWGLAESSETVLLQRQGDRAVQVNGVTGDKDKGGPLAREVSLQAQGGSPALRALLGGSGSGIARDARGEEVVAAWRQVPVLGWGLSVSIDTAEAFEPVYALRNRLLAALGLAVVLALGLAMLIGRRMVEPMEMLTESAARIAGGRLDERAPVCGFAEFRELARSFNRMTEQLVAERQSLEQRVEQRTEALNDSEQRFRGVFESAQVGIALCDAQGLIQQVNTSLTAMLCRSADELMGKHLSDLPDFRPGQPGRQVLARLLAGKVDHVRFQRGFALPGGGELFADLTGSVIRDERGRVINVVKMLTDVTERHRAEVDLVRSRLAAESASQAKSDFLANMSHEIRTPMSGALGMLNLLLRTELTPRQHDYASKARTAAQALLGVINDILDFSKVEAGKMELDLHRFDFAEFMRELAVILSANVGDKAVEVLFRLDPRIPPTLMGDTTRLRQVLLNLAGNALKFTEHGEVVVAVTLRGSEAGRARLHFEVTDTGIGIAAEKLPFLFEGFSQAEQSTARRYGGTGLGLAISRRLVDLMGGELRVESELREGSRFHFELELGVATQALERPARPERHLRVLIVDDNATAREVLQGIVQSLGWEAEMVADGEQALQRLQQLAESGGPRFDLVLMDWQMPGLDGWEVSQRIRSAGALDAPVIIMVTAHGRELLAERSELEVAHLGGYLVKPVTASMVYDAFVDATQGRPGTLRDAEGMQRLAGLHLLVVEDNRFNQQVAQELLEGEGAIVTLAGGGVEGTQVALSAQPPFDVVLMDLQMPDIDGFEATRRILARRPGALIVAMTANAMASDREACLAAGMRGHVAKPIDLDELVVCLRALVPEVPGGELAPVATAEAADEATAARASGDAAAQPPALLDVEAALQRLGGRRALYDRLAAAFAQDAPAELDALRQQSRRGSPVDALRALHTLRGLAGAVGAVALAALAGRHERSVRALMADPPVAAREAEAAVAPLERLLEASLQALGQAGQAPVAQPGEGADAPRPLETLRRLRQLLVERNMRSVTLTEELTASGQDLGPEFATLATAVARLDFARALRACDHLLERLNPR